MESTRDEAASGRSELIYCGLCGALNPASNHFCAACGTTLVDAFHGTEGLRVFERPDPPARLIEIVPAGSELDIVDDPSAPADYVRVRLAHGRLGYIRLHDVRAGAGGPPAPVARLPDINTNARGCVSTTAALAALVLLVVTATFGVVLIRRADPAEAGVLTLFFCVVLGPLLVLTVGLYVAARSREDRLAEEEEDSGQRAVGRGQTAEGRGQPAEHD